MPGLGTFVLGRLVEQALLPGTYYTPVILSPAVNNPVDNRVPVDSGATGSRQRQRVVIPKPTSMRPKPIPRFHRPSDSIGKRWEVM